MTQCTCLFCVLYIEAVPVSTPYCLPSLLATANQMGRFGEAPHGSRADLYRRKNGVHVYEHYTRQNHPMETRNKSCTIIIKVIQIIDSVYGLIYTA